MRTTRAFKITVILAILFVSVFCLVNAKPDMWESSEFRAERRNVAQYLKEKYGQDFIVKKVEYYTAYLGDKRQIWTHVVSKDDPPIEFIVARYISQSGPDYYETSLLLGQNDNQNYLELKWDQESEAKLKNVAEQIFSRPTLLFTNIAVPRYYSNQKFSTVPSYFEILKTNPEIFQDKVARQYVQLVFFYNVDETNEAQEAEKIYAFMDELQKMGIHNYRLGVDYFTPDFAEEAQRVIARIGLDAFMRVEQGWWATREYSGSGGERRNYIFLKEEDVNSIKNSTDIFKYFQKGDKTLWPRKKNT